MQRRYVTSMSRAIFDEHGKEMLEGLIKYWPQAEIFCYSEDTLPEMAGVTHKSIWKVPGAELFIKFTGSFPALCGIIDNTRHYTKDAHTFSKKVFAQIDAACEFPGHLFWVDADVKTFNHIPARLLEDWMIGKFMCVMRRKTWHLCSSFVGWDCSHTFANGFFNHWYQVYMSGTIFLLQQWDDAFVLEQVIQTIPGIRDLGEDITGEGPYNVFDNVFDGMAKHLKGNLKVAMRYQQLLELVAKLKPKTVIEVGTWNGYRALQMNQINPGMKYIGLDLFETATDDTDKLEKNVKAHHTLASVQQALESGHVDAELFCGDSRETFLKCLLAHGTQFADLIFIDGGHSVETIRSDLGHARRAIKPGGMIILDDFYSYMPGEELLKFGCQTVLAGMEYDLLPVKDSVSGGGKVQMAAVRC